MTVEIRCSPGKGRGVFACRHIPAHHSIAVVPANLYSPTDGAALLASPAFPYVFIDPAYPERHFLVWGSVALLNHSGEPNAKPLFTNAPGADPAHWQCNLVALRDIDEGDEITMRYANAADYTGLK